MNKVMFKYLQGYGIHLSCLLITKKKPKENTLEEGGNPTKKNLRIWAALHQGKRRNYENNQGLSRKQVSVYFIYCRYKGNDWPLPRHRSTCFQGALIQIWTVNMWKFVLIVIFLSLTVNLDKICVPLSWEIPIMALNFLGGFYAGFSHLRSLLDNMELK